LASSPTGVVDALSRAVTALDAIGARFCLVGGLARTFLAEARTTKDVDFAVSTESEAEVDRVIHALQAQGLVVREVFQRKDGRVATVRLTWGASPIRIDLLFTTSGLEQIVVRDSTRREVLPGVLVPVIRLPHLIAMKLVAGRDQDIIDIGALLQAATPSDRRLVPTLIEQLPAAKRATALKLWRKLSQR